MARLRNRIVKAEFWTDGELLRWPRDKRTTYKGLWALAEDSGCLEDDPFTWKLMLWPSPVDADITVKQLETWRDEFIAAGKMIPYEADGKTYLYLTKFHQHEHPRNPQRPDLPLPAWLAWEGNESDVRKGQYREVSEVVQALNSEPTSVPVPSCPAPSGSPKHLSGEPDQAAEVFAYWKRVLGHPDAKFGPERRRKIQARLREGYTSEQLKAAVNGCRASPHHMGVNDTGTIYDSVELIFRNGEKVEYFMARNGGARDDPVAHARRVRSELGDEAARALVSDVEWQEVIRG